MESIPSLRSLPRNFAGVEVHVFCKLDIWYHQITRMCPLGLRLRTFLFTTMWCLFLEQCYFIQSHYIGCRITHIMSRLYLKRLFLPVPLDQLPSLALTHLTSLAGQDCDLALRHEEAARPGQDLLRAHLFVFEFVFVLQDLLLAHLLLLLHQGQLLPLALCVFRLLW